MEIKDGVQVPAIKLEKDGHTYFIIGNGDIEMYEGRKCGYGDFAQFLNANKVQNHEDSN